MWPLIANISSVRSKGPVQYADLVRTFANRDSISASQVEKDLRRTFPHNAVIQSDENIQKLRRVLVVYSFVDPDIGYCQSMNFIAALLLLHLSEEDAFWTLTRLLEDIMPPGYYTQNMLGM
jgi:TBC1 domain family member 8/9